MKKLICSIAFILIGLFITDRVGGIAMNWVCQHSNDVLAPKLRYLQKEVNEDIILMGASRCHHHYLPSIIEDSLGASVYNAGIGGSNNIYSHYIVLQHILARHTPKLICLEVMPTDYCPQEDVFGVISFFAPLFGNSEEADSIYKLAGKYWRYEVSHLYRYNAKAASNIIGLVINRQKNEEKGYIPLPKPNQFPQEASKEECVTATDSMKLVYIHRFINLCKQHDIRLVFTASPKYTTVDVSHYDVLKSLAKEHDIPFLDYHTRGLYLDHPEYFKDNSHLWDEGARHFTSIFAGDLKRLFNLI